MAEAPDRPEEAVTEDLADVMSHDVEPQRFAEVRETDADWIVLSADLGEFVASDTWGDVPR